MSSFKWSNPVARVVVFGIGLLLSSLGFAAHVGGFHPNVGNGGWNHPDYNYHNNTNVGNYHPGNGWIAPAYVAPAYVAPTYIINGTDDNYNCQSVQQCDSNGNCIQTQSCN